MKANVLPNDFVWTKIKDDSGQHVSMILNRKELERQAGKAETGDAATRRGGRSQLRPCADRLRDAVYLRPPHRQSES